MPGGSGVFAWSLQVRGQVQRAGGSFRQREERAQRQAIQGGNVRTQGQGACAVGQVETPLCGKGGEIVVDPAGKGV